MEKYEISNDNNQEILKTLIDIILRKHPIVEDRSHVLYPNFNEPRTPEMEIHFNFYNEDEKSITQVIFMDGTKSYKESIPDMVITDGLISKEIVCIFIDYLLLDHDWFKDIYKYHTNIKIPMGVSSNDCMMNGISCGEICLNLDFNNHSDGKVLLNEYFKVIVIRYYEKLKHTNSFDGWFSEYCNFVKSDFINSLTIEEMKKFITSLNGDDLCNLIYSIPNDRFIELYNDYNSNDDVKTLIKGGY